MPSDDTILLAFAAFCVLAAILGIAALSIVSSWPYRKPKSAPLAACPLCSYSFAGLAANSACPECGAPHHKQIAAARAREPDRLRNIFRAPIWVIFAIGGLVAVLFSLHMTRGEWIPALFITALCAVPFVPLLTTLPSIARRTSRTNLCIWTIVGTLSILAAQVAITTLVMMTRDAQAGLAFLYAPVLGTLTLAIGLFFAAAVLHRSTTRRSAASKPTASKTQ